ncbi:MAG TPA: CerR family C-terminal domain-containing protein [Bauldia sp.]|nr:CerR family C-terminal domain-containing protein [Bauldia sp.]
MGEAVRRRTGTAEEQPTRPAAAESTSTSTKGQRHYRRARQDRGAETRHRLIEAALDIFGRHGFEGATTRQIAKEAKANLAAIVYHFGSKEALHVAVAEYIATRIAALVGPSLALAGAPDAATTPSKARAALAHLLETYADVILGEKEAERWARFIVREQMQPTAAFDVIYKYMGGAHGVGARLVAAILGRSPDDEAVRLSVFAIMGQILVFRVARELVLRRMGWRTIGERERTAIKAIVLAQVNAILDKSVLP